MSKRFTATEIWDEDWFLEMPIEYKLFWYYMLSTCDHAGLFKVNLRSFCGLNEVKIDSDTALAYFNSGKKRIMVVNQSVWLIEDFFAFQYGHKINLNNPLHRGVEKALSKFDLKLTSIRGLFEETEGLKEKDKEINSINLKKEKNGQQLVNFKAQGENVMLGRLARNQVEANTNGKKDI